MTQEDKTIIISLGGSIIVPEKPDPEYIKQFISLINDFVLQNVKFVIIVGGGKTCRNYQNALREIRTVTNEDLDWLGIHTTVFNAQFIKSAFGDSVHNKIIQDPTELDSSDSMITICAGWKPGCSTDYDAILFAKQCGATSVVNLSNIEYAYDKDPKNHLDAKPIINSSWADFRKILPLEWNPGSNTPFDPIAAKEAEESGIEVVIMNGRNLDNFKSYLEGNEFVGTRIK